MFEVSPNCIVKWLPTPSLQTVTVTMTEIGQMVVTTGVNFQHTHPTTSSPVNSSSHQHAVQFLFLVKKSYFPEYLIQL